jgi:hypothetical protein
MDTGSEGLGSGREGFRIHWARAAAPGWAGGRAVDAIGENAEKGKCRRTGRWAGRVAPQRSPWAASPRRAGLMAAAGKDRGGPKGGAPDGRPDCAYASATDVRCIPHRGWCVRAS